VIELHSSFNYLCFYTINLYFMKKLLVYLILIVSVTAEAQQINTIKTSGKYILGPCNDTITLKGINYAPYNWGYTLSDLKMDEIAQTGANTVRIVWYWNNTGASIYSNYVALDSAISKCIQKKMIAIIELHDFTCGNNATTLINGTTWFTNSSVFPILNKYKHSLIINIANEALQVNWTGNPTAALATYKSTYQTIITNLRNVSGFDFPLMIDAPDCGQHSDAFITSNTATDLINHDPQHNIIFSTHAYWYGYANNDSLQMAGKINSLLSQNFPFVLGEIANLQDDATMCQYTLNYRPLLNYCAVKKVGWLAWSWDHDGCSARQVSANGSFSSLTPYGNDIVNNATYGLLSHPAAKSRYLVTNGCALSTRLQETVVTQETTVFPNPGNGVFSIDSPVPVKAVTVKDLLGKNIEVERTGYNSFSIPHTNGVYIVTIINYNNTSKIVKLILN